MPRLLRFIIRNAAVSSPIFGGIMCRLSSPWGGFSTWMTSGPMSASRRVQVGPAITWVRSTTLNPDSGPTCALPVWIDLAAGLLACPLRLALVQERVHAFAEIPAHVAHQDQILALFAREPRLQAPQRFLGGAQRERRVAGDQARELVGAALGRRAIFPHF